MDMVGRGSKLPVPVELARPRYGSPPASYAGPLPPATGQAAPTLDERMDGYLGHLLAVYPAGKPSVTVSRISLKHGRRFTRHEASIAVRSWEGQRLLEPFYTDGSNPWYRFDLRKVRRYLVQRRSGRP